jgi:hypothetical protein
MAAAAWYLRWMRRLTIAAAVLAGCATSSSEPRVAPDDGAPTSDGAQRSTEQLGADRDDPRLIPAPHLQGALATPGPEALWGYLLEHANAPVHGGSFCSAHVADRPPAEHTLGNLLASYLGNSSGDARALLEIGCGPPGADDGFAAADSPACPPREAERGECLRCAMVIQLDEVTEDPALFLVYGKLLFQYRRGAPLDPASIFCVEAG